MGGRPSLATETRHPALDVYKLLEHADNIGGLQMYKIFRVGFIVSLV